MSLVDMVTGVAVLLTFYNGVALGFMLAQRTEPIVSPWVAFLWPYLVWSAWRTR
jgi:hypothetical protein